VFESQSSSRSFLILELEALALQAEAPDLPTFLVDRLALEATAARFFLRLQPGRELRGIHTAAAKARRALLLRPTDPRDRLAHGRRRGSDRIVRGLQGLAHSIFFMPST
jgi:hypothetical protein